jgi:hypothetical protein
MYHKDTFHVTCPLSRNFIAAAAEIREKMAAPLQEVLERSMKRTFLSFHEADANDAEEFAARCVHFRCIEF